MLKYKDQMYGDIDLRFDSDIERDLFVTIKQDPGDSVWMTKKIAIRIAKMILKRYAPEALK